MEQKSNQSAIDGIIWNLFHVLPMIHKKLLRMDLNGVTGKYSRLHLAIMGKLSKGNLTVSEIARQLAIPKSHMTHLIDQLVESDVIARRADVHDRRVINLSLTEHGEKVFKECLDMVKANIREKLSVLTQAELMAMADSLERLKSIQEKLD